MSDPSLSESGSIWENGDDELLQIQFVEVKFIRYVRMPRKWRHYDGIVIVEPAYILSWHRSWNKKCIIRTKSAAGNALDSNNSQKRISIYKPLMSDTVYTVMRDCK